jgi:riboflavin biosynthesis pyrimidine reductase
LTQSIEEAPLWVVGALGVRAARRAAMERAGVRVTEVRRGSDGGLDLPVTWRGLTHGGVRSVLVEGGGRLASGLLDEGLVQRLHLIYASRFIGPHGVEGFPGLSSALDEHWCVTGRRELGEDTLITLESLSSLAALKSM